MGGEIDGFDRASMYDFQLLRDKFYAQNGIEEETITSSEDLDNLYAKVDPEVMKQWH